MWQFQFNCHCTSKAAAKVTPVIGVSRSHYCHPSRSAIEGHRPCCLRCRAAPELLCGSITACHSSTRCPQSEVAGSTSGQLACSLSQLKTSNSIPPPQLKQGGLRFESLWKCCRERSGTRLFVLQGTRSEGFFFFFF